MQLGEKEIIAYLVTVSTIVGYALRHFIPLLFKSNFWKYIKVSDSTSLLNNEKGGISFLEHERICEPTKTKINEISSQFIELKISTKHISTEIRWLRALAVVQSSQEAIKKANEITGIN